MKQALIKAVKHIVHAGKKNITLKGEIEDLKKALWYLNREIYRLECHEAGGTIPKLGGVCSFSDDLFRE